MHNPGFRSSRRLRRPRKPPLAAAETSSGGRENLLCPSPHSSSGIYFSSVML